MNNIGNNEIDNIIISAIKEDIGDGDHTSLATIPSTKYGKVKLVAKEAGIICGLKIAERVFTLIDKKIIFHEKISDGNTVKVGDIIFEAEGKSSSLLSAERTALNFMQRMSGIATATRTLVNTISGSNTTILDTRKTTPNNRILEKYAVTVGGGSNHRFGLFDMMMIKDNHVDFAGGIVPAISSCHAYLKKHNKSLKIEIEVRNFHELQQVLDYGQIDRIMLDNFTPENTAKALSMINKRFETESSGNITIDNIKEYADTGVDYISIGALTHHIKSLDISLLMTT